MELTYKCLFRPLCPLYETSMTTVVQIGLMLGKMSKVLLHPTLLLWWTLEENETELFAVFTRRKPQGLKCMQPFSTTHVNADGRSVLDACKYGTKVERVLFGVACRIGWIHLEGCAMLVATCGHT